MAIPKLKKQDVIDALKFIDENGVPEIESSIPLLYTLPALILQKM